MEEMIIQELKRIKLDVGYVWRFPEWIVFRNKLLSREKLKFDKVIEDMINQGAFEVVNSSEDNKDLRLTQVGYDILYGTD